MDVCGCEVNISRWPFFFARSFLFSLKLAELALKNLLFEPHAITLKDLGMLVTLVCLHVCLLFLQFPPSVNSGSSKRMNTNGTTAAGVGSWDGASSNGAAAQQFF